MKKQILQYRLRHLVLLIVSLYGATAFAQPSLSYARKFTGSAYDYGNSIAIDAAGNTYTTGLFQDTVDFDPNAGTYNLTAVLGDAFVTKLDVNGNLVWAHQLGGSTGDRGMGIAVDASGNVYTTGYFTDEVDFDPSVAGSALLTSLGESDIFVCKFDASGNYVWAKQLGGPGYDYSFAIGLDASGNVYTAGKFQGTSDFDPSLGTASLSSASGSEDIFVSKLDASGNYVWAKRLGAGLNDAANAMSIDVSDNVYLAGYFQSTVDFDPNAGICNLTSNGGEDVFVTKISSAGSLVWAKSFGGTSNDEANGLRTDASGNVYLCGFFQGTTDMDPGAGVSNAVSLGGTDAFVSAFNSTGNLGWDKTFGGTANDKANGLDLDPSGNVFCTGYFQSNVDFDPGPGNSLLTSAGGFDVFILGLGNGGGYGWARQMGGTSDDEAAAIRVDAMYIYTTGYFQGTADFDPDAGVTNLVSLSSFDIFVSKLGYKPELLPVELIAFDAAPQNNDVVLSWTTASESNNDFFAIERSVDGRNWEMVGEKPGAGNSVLTLNYQLVDQNPYYGLQYYRLKQTDYDGAFTYSAPVAVEFGSSNETVLSLYPNPASDYLKVSMHGFDENISFRVLSLTGQVLMQQESTIGSVVSFDVSAQPKGIYLVEVSHGQDTEVMRWVKQ